MMKKIVCVAAVILCIFVVSGCRSTQAAVSPAGNANVPDWISEMPPEDVLWGIGSAKQSTETLSMTMADTRARQDLARQLSVLAEGMVTDYGRDAGSVNNQASLQLAESVSRQLTSAKLTGAIPIRRWKAPDNTWWYLVQLRKSDAAQEAADVIESEASLYAEFKTMRALDLMDAKLKESLSKPQIVTE
jgi:hypothetical protein